MEISRRRLIQAGFAAAGTAALVPPLTAQRAQRAQAAVPLGLTPFTEALAVPGILDMRGGGLAELTMRNAQHRFHPGLGPTSTLSYQHASLPMTYLGPVIVAQKGQPFTLRVHNELGPHPLAFAVDDGLVPPGSADRTAPRASLHLHGGNTRSDSDGGPTDTFLPGQSYDYHYDNHQDAAGLWYHDHALGITRLNVYAGLASGYLLRDAPGSGIDTGDGVHLPASPFEVPLIIQDRVFAEDGSFAYPPNPDLDRPWSPEFFGDVATVNGTAWPTLDVARGKYRFRVYNGSNARFYLLRFSHGGESLPFEQIGTDGGLLDAPVRFTRLVLGPGERADIVVDFSLLAAGSAVVLANSARSPFPDGPVAVRRGGMPLPQIMQFRVTSAPGFTAPIPVQLRPTPMTRLAHVAAGLEDLTVRPMALVEVVDEDDVPITALLNNRHFADPYPTVVAKDSLELWELVNTTGDAHPIHLHFVQFQVLDRQRLHVDRYIEATDFADPETGLVVPGRGAAVSPEPFLIGRPSPPPERGWKDTIVAMPGEVTRILVPFGAGAAGGAPLAMGSSFTGPYVWHCHILEHEDNDMMRPYVIEA
ncbi:multicopper oxidase [Sinomonas halotolerans]|uniref:Multicopper oxidase n=1 Tax=Sinomonas halotolerans TaxID=1644133 RepID=A0ABU9WV56_9MICC